MQRMDIVPFRRGLRTPLIALTLLLFTFLAIGVRGLNFEPGQPTGLVHASPAQRAVVDLTRTLADIPVWRQLLSAALLFLLAGLAASLLSAELRKRLLRVFLRLAASVLVLIFVVDRNPRLLSILEEATAIGAVGSVSDGADTVPAPVFHAPQLSPLLAYLLSLAVVAGLLGLAWFLGTWRRRTTTAMRPASLKALGRIARASLDDVVGGRDWGDAIIRCYDQMSRVVDRQRGLNRPVSTTPAEFAMRLEAAGLPTEPVRRLTRLFESVRYGAHTASKVEISEAVSCLGTIADFCGMPA